MGGERRSPKGADGFEGAVAGLGLADIIQLNGHNHFSGCVTVQSQSSSGRVFFRDGQIVHAEADDLKGEPAFYEIMQWPGGKFSVQPNVSTAVRSIERTWEFLLMDAYRLIDEGRRSGRLPPAPKPGEARPSRGPWIAIAGVVLVLAAAGAAAYWYLGRSQAPATTAQRAAREGSPAAALAQPILRITGSDALCARLAPAIAGAYLASLGATGVDAAPPAGHDVVVRGTLDGAPRTIAIASRATAAAFDDLLAGSTDVVVSTRRIKADERRRLAALGSMTSAANEHVLGLGALAVVVNNANGVAQLQRKQLAAIFSGEVTDWSALGLASDAQAEWSSVGVGGGKGGPIAAGLQAFAPDGNAGIGEVFQALVLGGRAFAPEVKQLPSLQAVTDGVIANPGGVGFVPLSQAAGVRMVPVSDADDPALLPTTFTVATEEYLLTHRLYLYNAQSPSSPHVARFVELALGPQGQAEVKKAGFVELSVRAEARAVPAGAPAEYVKLTAKARRLSTTFRFEPGSAALDNRALRDVDRVVDYLRDNNLSGASVRVLGFADAQGPKALNVKLSRERAALVVQALQQRGIAGVSVAALGSALPIADNSNDRGRDRNRRVEIWITR